MPYNSGITLAYMIRRVRAKVDEPLAFRISDSEIVEILNSLYKDLCGRCPSHLLDNLTTQKMFDLTANCEYTGTKSTDFPDLMKVRAALLLDPGSNEYFPVKVETNMETINRPSFRQRGYNQPLVWLDFPTDVTPTYEAFFVYPKPRQNITSGLIVYYIKDPLDLSALSTGVIPSLPYQMLEYLILGACSEILKSPKFNRPEYGAVFQSLYELKVNDFLARNPEPPAEEYIMEDTPLSEMV